MSRRAGFVAMYPNEIMQLLWCNVTLRETTDKKKVMAGVARASVRADDGVRAYGERRPLRRDTLRGPGSHVL